MWDVTDVGLPVQCGTVPHCGVPLYRSVVPLYHMGALLMMPHGTRHTVISGGSIKYQVTSIEPLLFIRFQELMIPHGTQWSLVRVPRSKY